MNEHLFNFKEHLKILNRSSATIDAYSDHSRHFMTALNGTDLRKVTTRMIESFIAELYDHRTKKGSPYSPYTITVKVRAIKRFFEYLEQSNVILINPAEFIIEPKLLKDRIKTTLTPTEVAKILDQPNLGTWKGIRDRAILELFYSTGIRLAELCSLTIYDPDLQGNMLRINNGKGRKDRVVPMGRHAVKCLREYIAKVRPHFTKKNRASRILFVNTFGGPVSAQVVCIMIRRHAKASGIKKQVTAHTFRHTFATVLVKNGADIVSVQKMMGHTDIKTTQGYLQTLGVDLKKEHERTHPREKDKEKASAATPFIQKIRGENERKQH
ncbi:MAG: tyrosine-type recombinase/integrase [Desulfobacteraceae bacterium]|nr:tyrosine-type recombinase/integrase [Desulfobacteraceae bacterium]